MHALVFLCFLITVCSSHTHDYNRRDLLKEIYSWTKCDFLYPSEEERQSAICNGSFVPGNCMPIDLQPVGKRIIVTTPRFKGGIPATVSTVSTPIIECANQSTSPLFQPYPDWSWNNGDMGCDGFQSVFGVNVDKCNRLWVIDTAVINIALPTVTRTCPAQLLSFDLSNDQLIRRYTVPESILQPSSLLISVILDTINIANNCKSAYAYIADITAYGILVFDTNTGNSWRVENKLFYPYPSWGTLIVNHERLETVDGITSLALFPDPSPRMRRVYFHALASARENYVPAYILRDSKLASNRSHDFFFSIGRKPTQAAGAAFDDRGILFFGFIGKSSLACWNPFLEHVPKNIIQLVRDKEALPFVSGMKVDNEGRIWLMTIEYVSYFLGTVKPNQVNFRILVGSAKALTEGTPCDTGHKGYGGGFIPYE